MATVNLILNTFYSNPDEKSPKYPIVFVIRNNNRHSYINTGIKLEKKYWDDKKWIKKNAPGIISRVKKNAELQQKLADIQTFITELTTAGGIRTMSPKEIKRRYEDKKSKEKYNFNTYFNTYFKYGIEKKPIRPKVFINIL